MTQTTTATGASQQQPQIAMSQGELNMFARCPRQWMITYFLGFVPAVTVPVGTAQLGIRVHTALEGLYGYDADPLKVLDLLYRTAIEANPDYESELRKEWELARAMVEGYCEWVLMENVDADFKVVSTEEDVKVAVPGLPGVLLRMRLDQVLQQISTGFQFFLDFKTAASFDAHETLELHTQFKTYSVGSYLRAGLDWAQPHPDFAPVVGGGIIRTLRRVKRTERAVPPFYRHDPFRYNPEQLTATLARIQKIAGEIMTARAHLDSGYAPPYNGDLEVINSIQRYHLRPVPIPADCSWRCPASSGLCVAMDDGSSWPEMLERSGRWRRGDPYAHYEEGGIAGIRDQLARL
jgi:hypothetical protein